MLRQNAGHPPCWGGSPCLNARFRAAACHGAVSLHNSAGCCCPVRDRITPAGVEGQQRGPRGTVAFVGKKTEAGGAPASSMQTDAQGRHRHPTPVPAPRPAHKKTPAAAWGCSGGCDLLCQVRANSRDTRTKQVSSDASAATAASGETGETEQGNSARRGNRDVHTVATLPRVAVSILTLEAGFEVNVVVA